MLSTSTDRQTQFAGLFALIAIAVATVLFVSAMLVGLRGASVEEDATNFEAESRPEVRYVLQYEVDDELYSFYEEQGTHRVASAGQGLLR